MSKYFLKSFALFLLSFSWNAFSSSLSEDAIMRGINSTCISYIRQIEKSYNLNGLKITFAHHASPSELPSLHVTSQRFNNGSSTFSANLIPDDDYCYLSTVLVTTINNQSCLEIAQLKEKNQNLQLESYADGAYIILTPPDNSYQTILTSSGEKKCTMTEAQIMWPGR